MFFVESGIAMEKDPQTSMSSYTMFAETVELLKYKLIVKSFSVNVKLHVYKASECKVDSSTLSRSQIFKCFCFFISKQELKVLAPLLNLIHALVLLHILYSHRFVLKLKNTVDPSAPASEKDFSALW